MRISFSFVLLIASLFSHGQVTTFISEVDPEKTENYDFSRRTTSKKDLIETTENRDKIIRELKEIEANLKIEQEKSKVRALEKEKQNLRSRQNFQITLSILCLVILALLFLRYYKQKKEQVIRQRLELEKKSLIAINAELKLKEITNTILIKNNIIQSLNSQLKARTPSKESQDFFTNSVMENLIITKEDASLFLEEFCILFPGYIESISSNFSSLTKNDKLIIALTTLDIVNKDQANILGVSLRSLTIARYRLKKRIISDDNVALKDFILQKKAQYSNR